MVHMVFHCCWCEALCLLPALEFRLFLVGLKHRCPHGVSLLLVRGSLLVTSIAVSLCFVLDVKHRLQKHCSRRVLLSFVARRQFQASHSELCPQRLVFSSAERKVLLHEWFGESLQTIILSSLPKLSSRQLFFKHRFK